MELEAIIEHIKRLPKQAQTVLLSGLKLTVAKNTPSGAVLVALQLDGAFAKASKVWPGRQPGNRE